MTSAMEEKRHVDDMGAQCRSCVGRSFRRSRLKVKDMWSLLVLRYPVRCLSCSIRQTVSLPVAARAVSSKVRQVRAAQSRGGAGDEAQRQQPSMVGGSGSWAIPVHEPMTMPDLQGVTLKHTSSLPITDETSPK
jgi:hypothetical protein